MSTICAHYECSQRVAYGHSLCSAHLAEQRELDASIKRADEALKRLEQRKATTKERP